MLTLALTGLFIDNIAVRVLQILEKNKQERVWRSKEMNPVLYISVDFELSVSLLVLFYCYSKVPRILYWALLF